MSHLRSGAGYLLPHDLTAALLWHWQVCMELVTRRGCFSSSVLYMPLVGAHSMMNAPSPKMNRKSDQSRGENASVSFSPFKPSAGCPPRPCCRAAQ